MCPFVDQSLLQFTKREWDALIASRGVWIGIFATGVVLGIIGPFGTDEILRVFPRSAYWLIVAGVTFITGNCIAGGLLSYVRAIGLPVWVCFPVICLISSALIYGEVFAINWLVFGPLPHPVDQVILAVNIFAIVTVVTFAIYVAVPSTPLAEDSAPRILERLPVPLRGRLLSLSVTDHYVHVSTDQGTHMLLMRLSDAIVETAPEEGLQIHRSHWVALDAIERVERGPRKCEAVLQNGARLPVSRTYLPQLKQAGFLPKSGT
jgi:uncharacterized membrane protein YphA (DoxX/SURF4 family)